MVIRINLTVRDPECHGCILNKTVKRTLWDFETQEITRLLTSYYVISNDSKTNRHNSFDIQLLNKLGK